MGLAGNLRQVGLLANSCSPFWAWRRRSSGSTRGRAVRPRTLTGQGRALARLGQETRSRGIALVCLHSGGFTRAQCARFLDAHSEQGRWVVLALIVRGVVVEETVSASGGSATCAGSMPGALYDGRGRASPSKRPMRRVEPARFTGSFGAAKAGEQATFRGHAPRDPGKADEGLRPLYPDQVRALNEVRGLQSVLPVR